MDIQKTVIQAKPVTLSDKDQEEIVTFVLDAWSKGKKDRKPYEDHWKACEKAYHCEREPITDPEMDWASNLCLPWAYDASESWYAHIHSTTIPKNDKIIQISGRNTEDHPGADIMQRYLEYCFERNQFAQQLGRDQKDLSIRNHSCLKVYWRTDITIEYNWVDEPVVDPLGLPVINPETGAQLTKKRRAPQERTTFNNVWFDVIDIDNFVTYPIYGDINKSTRIHETYRPYEDLMATADKTNYFNLDKLSLDDEKHNTNPKRTEEAEGPKGQRQGLNIKEAWIYRVKIGDKVYRNYVATIVNDKVVVRFQPFPPYCPNSPFVFMALRPDKDCHYGFGLNSKGLCVLEAANKVFNCKLDEILLNIHNPKKYYEDGVFNPNNVVNRPGAMIEMSKESVSDNLIPLIEYQQGVQLAYQEVAELKVEFETVTVPKVVKGMIEVGTGNTATEITQAQNNSSGKMHIDAFNINDNLILKAYRLAYQAIYDRAQYDESVIQEILQVTQPKDDNGQPLTELPLLPLPEVDIKVVGYQNVIRRQEQLAGMSQALPLLAQSPGGKYLKYENVGEDTLRMLDLDVDRLWMNEEERAKVDQQAQQAAEQQQQLLIEQETKKFQLQKEKQDQDYQIKLQELELKRKELELKIQQQAHNEAMGERQASFNEYQAEKEPPKDEE